MSADLPRSLWYTPYFAGLEDKTEEDSAILEERIDRLPSGIRLFLFDEHLPEQLATAARQSGLPDQYSIAFSKIVFLIILGDVPVTAAGQLLEKLGVAPDVAAMLGGALGQILQPLATARTQQSGSQWMKPIQPLTQRISALKPPPPPGPQPPERNILDLRNKPQT